MADQPEQRDKVEAIQRERGQHAALGEFVMEFSQLEFTIRTRVAWFFGRLHKEASALIESMETAKIVDALPRLARLRGVKGRALAEIDAVHDEFMDINTQRVTAAHGIWSTDAEGTMAVWRRPKKKGATDTRSSLTTPELDRLTERCLALMRRFLVLPVGPKRRRRKAAH